LPETQTGLPGIERLERSRRRDQNGQSVVILEGLLGKSHRTRRHHRRLGGPEVGPSSTSGVERDPAFADRGADHGRRHAGAGGQRAEKVMVVGGGAGSAPQEEDKLLLIRAADAQAMLDYLTARPWCEVYMLIPALLELQEAPLPAEPT